MGEVKGSFLGSATEMSHLEKTELRTLWMSLLEDSCFSPGFLEMLHMLNKVCNCWPVSCQQQGIITTATWHQKNSYAENYKQLTYSSSNLRNVSDQFHSLFNVFELPSSLSPSNKKLFFFFIIKHWLKDFKMYYIRGRNGVDSYSIHYLKFKNEKSKTTDLPKTC